MNRQSPRIFVSFNERESKRIFDNFRKTEHAYSVEERIPVRLRTHQRRSEQKASDFGRLAADSGSKSACQTLSGATKQSTPRIAQLCGSRDLNATSQRALIDLSPDIPYILPGR